MAYWPTRCCTSGIVVCLFTTNCVPQKPVVTLGPSAPCQEIIHPALLSVPFDELVQGRDDVEEWILAQFPTATVAFDPTRGGLGAIGQFSWSEGAKGFTLFLSESSRLIQQTSEQYPTLGHILRCYGDPAYYTLEEDVPVGGSVLGNRLELWYPGFWFKFQSDTWGPNKPSRYDVTSPIRGRIAIMPVGTIEEVISNWRSDEAYIQVQLELLREWPDDFTELVVKE